MLFPICYEIGSIKISIIAIHYGIVGKYSSILIFYSMFKMEMTEKVYIAILLLKFFAEVNIKELFESIHNYISDDNMIRKRAISATNGESALFQLNIRDGSLICTGKGNPDWNCSALHGAGRILNRSQAYEQITIEDFQTSMSEIYSESVTDFIRNETLMTYKPAEAIRDTVTIDTIIRSVCNFKAI